MKVKCTNCPAEIELGVEGEDIGDTAYKLICPALRDLACPLRPESVGRPPKGKVWRCAAATFMPLTELE